MSIQETMINDMQESIKKNLPQAIGEELQKLLEQGKKDAKQVVELTQTLARKNADISDYNALLQKHAALEDRQKRIEEGEKALQTAQLELATAKANLRAEIAEAKASTYSNVFTTIFQNTIVREATSRNVAIPLNGVNGGPGYVANQCEQENKATVQGTQTTPIPNVY